MNRRSDSVTSTTLLLRLRRSPSDEAAWAEFVRRYGSRIEGWCRQWGLQEADAQDVAQTVLLKLLQAARTFRYDPKQRFRGWLKTVTHHAWRDWARGRSRMAVGGVPDAEDPLRQVAARDDLAERLIEAFEQELFEEALARVRPRVQPRTWEAFQLTTFDGLSGAEAADRLKIAVTSVYKAKSNIRKLLETEVRYLEDGIAVG